MWTLRNVDHKKHDKDEKSKIGEGRENEEKWRDGDKGGREGGWIE
jgi:hypothetical protein